MNMLNIRLDEPGSALLVTPLVALLVAICRVHKAVSAPTARAYEIVALAVFFWFNRQRGNGRSTVSTSPHGTLLPGKFHLSAGFGRQISADVRPDLPRPEHIHQTL